MTHAAPRRRSRLRLLLPLTGAVLLILCGAALFRPARETHTVSEVIRSIQSIAREGADPAGPPGAGQIGPWSIAASGIDPITGHLADFRLESGPLVVAAKQAIVHVDPDDNTFSLELLEVVYTRIPETPDEDGDAFVHRMDRYVLGPAPYSIDIVTDSGATARPRTPEPDGWLPDIVQGSVERP
ncbi:MAG: hypothetical protein HKO59_10175 [Phycisphaerales bacterium]|nr:hypothetical protein [Phycisphaerae bacterium]NNF43421.1 hypothetical protein [Phycisphaerales bacterium]NNM26330.1 hypothetical protein [Phycisphaerales bacterium]